MAEVWGCLNVEENIYLLLLPSQLMVNYYLFIYDFLLLLLQGIRILPRRLYTIREPVSDLLNYLH